MMSRRFGDPYQMAMKIVNDDEIQSVHDFQAVSEKGEHHRSARGAENRNPTRYTSEDDTSVGGT